MQCRRRKSNTNAIIIDSTLPPWSNSNNNNSTITNAINPKTTKKPKIWRDLIAFWILGLCNNFGNMVLLTAAHDVIVRFEPQVSIHIEFIN